MIAIKNIGKHIQTNKLNIIVWLFLGIYLIRVLLTQLMGLMPQDSYYYLYSEHLAFSYFDHPPMVAYMLRMFSLILGKSVGAIKLTDLIVSLLSVIAFYQLSLRFIPRTKAVFVSIMYASTVMIGILSLNTTPDVPLILFFTLSILAIHKALTTGKTIHWALAGLCIGLAFDSKYTGLFLLAQLGLYLLLSGEHRHYLLSWKFFLLIMVTGVVMSPVIIWNIQHDWMSFKFQSVERSSSILSLTLKPRFFVGNLLTQFVLLGPIAFAMIIGIFYKFSKKAIINRKLPRTNVLFLTCFSVPLLSFFVVISSLYWVKLNWMMPGYIAAFVLLGYVIKKSNLRWHVLIAFIFHLLIFIQIVFYPVKVKSDDTWVGWEALYEQVDELKIQYPESFIFSDDGYKTSAILNFYMDEHVYSGNILDRNGLQFSVIDSNLDHLRGKNALFINSDNRSNSKSKSGRDPAVLHDYFETVTELDPIIVSDRSGRILRKFVVFGCLNYQKKPG